jgi:hypothetical protein
MEMGMNKFVAILRKLPRILFVGFFMTLLMTSGYYACGDDTTPRQDAEVDDSYIPEDGQQLIDGMTSD